MSIDKTKGCCIICAASGKNCSHGEQAIPDAPKTNQPVGLSLIQEIEAACTDTYPYGSTMSISRRDAERIAHRLQLRFQQREAAKVAEQPYLHGSGPLPNCFDQQPVHQSGCPCGKYIWDDESPKRESVDEDEAIQVMLSDWEPTRVVEASIKELMADAHESLRQAGYGIVKIKRNDSKGDQS